MPCPHCGHAALSHAGNHLVLPPGEMLQNRYLIGRTLGAGGFGITYLAKDLRNNTLCAVKEYLPAMLAVRKQGARQVFPSSMNNEENYAHGLAMFRREAQMLQSFTGNTSIVQVYNYFEENGTAYFVMEYLDGVNLKVLMRSMGGRVPLDLGAEVLHTIAHILDGVHKKGLLHRDVSPENIFLTKDGHIKLIDFGATRFYVGERSQSLSVILKPGFAPPEQYASHGNQGPWTDLYALCATFYYAVTGMAIPDAPDRLAGESAVPLAVAIPKIWPNLAAAVESGLQLDYRMRPQSMTEFCSTIDATAAASVAASRQVSVPNKESLQGIPYIQSVRGGLAQDKWTIPKNMRMSIGRAAELCNIVVDFPNVSRIHCTIQYDDKKRLFYLTDQSTNGTLTQAGRLGKGQTQALQPGDYFYITVQENMFKVGLE